MATDQATLTSETALQIAKRATRQLDSIDDQTLAAWYSWLDVGKIYRIADGKLDPLKAIHADHVIRPIPSRFSGNPRDFMNLGLSLHHFSAHSNHASILQHGLLSYRRVQEKGIVPTFVSSDSSREIDARRGLDNYVHLSFTAKSAMSYSVEGRTIDPLVDYRVSPLVLTRPGTLFCRGYANANGAEWIPFEEMTPLDLIALFIGFNRMSYWQLMVDDLIPTNHLKVDDSIVRLRGN